MTKVFILVGENWRAARLMALQLNERNIPVEIMIKEKVSKEVLQLITPKPHIRIKAWPRSVFSIFSFWRILVGTGQEKRGIVTTDHKTYAFYHRLESLLDYQTFLLRMGEIGYILTRDGRPYELQDCLNL